MAAVFATGVAVGVGAACAVGWWRSERQGDQEEEFPEDSDSDESSEPANSIVRDDYTAEETYKMLLIVNMELYKVSSKTSELKSVKMSAGKAAAQASHATLGAYRRAVRLCPKAVREWLQIGQMKITVKLPHSKLAGRERYMRAPPTVAVCGLCVRRRLSAPRWQSYWTYRRRVQPLDSTRILFATPGIPKSSPARGQFLPSAQHQPVQWIHSHAT